MVLSVKGQVYGAHIRVKIILKTHLETSSVHFIELLLNTRMCHNGVCWT